MSYQETKLQAIADAIREKDGTTEPIPANDFAARIRAIPTGGLPDNVHTITLTADPPEGGTVSGGGYASDGMKVTVSAANGEGYSFSQWQENGAPVSTDADYAFTVTGNRTLTAAFAEGRLPTGYTELEYIASSGTQYILTGFAPNGNSRVVVDFQNTDGNTSAACIFGRDTGWASNAFDLWIHAVVFGTQYSTFSSTTQRVVMDLNKGKLTRDGVQIASLRATSFSSGYPLALFGLNRSGNVIEKITATLYSCQIYDSDVLVRNFVPCTNSSGNIGLYDLVGAQFYANAGTGTFTAGPAV